MLEGNTEIELGHAKGYEFGKFTIIDPDGNSGAISQEGHSVKLVSTPPGLGVKKFDVQQSGSHGEPKHNCGRRPQVVPFEFVLI